MKKTSVLAVAAFAPTLFAADLDFWGTGTSDATNVVATASLSKSSSLDLRFRQERVSDGFTYSTRPRGAVLTIR